MPLSSGSSGLFLDFLTLKMKALRPFDTFLNYSPTEQHHIARHSIKTPASLCLMHSTRVTLIASFLHLSNITNKFLTLTSKIYAHTNVILLKIIGVYKRLIDKNLRLGLYTSAQEKIKRPVTFICSLDTAIKWKVRYTVEL